MYYSCMNNNDIDDMDINDTFFEDLAKSCPELLQRSRIGESFGVKKGWHTIIRVLCELLYSPVHNAKLRYTYSLERDDVEHTEKCKKELETALAELPVIAQVKEKFGTLRFYTDNCTERDYALISFAEAMSAYTCEDCGDKGESGAPQGGGWIRTACSKHKRK